MQIKARIPGTIIAVNVKVGDEVKARSRSGNAGGDENGAAIACPLDGIVKAVNVQVGDKIKTGMVMIEVE